MIITSKDKINIESDFKIEAGPGAGKTEFLVNHIKNVIQNSDRLGCTRKIACITYTNTAVEIILKRLGKGVSNKVEVSTIHSFLYRHVVKPYCSFISDEYELCFGRVKGHDDFYVSKKYINEWLEHKDFDKLTNPNSKNQLLRLPVQIQALQNWLRSIKCMYENGKIGFCCDNTKALAFEKGRAKPMRLAAKNLNILSEKLVELKKIYWRKGRLDHNDVLFFSYILIDMYPFVLDVLRAKFPYMFVDEYQDTNPIQSFILDEIRQKEAIVGVIGDKAQSIYSFQEATPSLFDSFDVDDDYIFTIEDNHRSTNQIVKFLNDIRSDICQNPEKNIDDQEVSLCIGDRNAAYGAACYACGTNPLVQSLSRDNVTSNAMKKAIEGAHLDGKLSERFEAADSNAERRKYILSFIQAIELSVNGKYKDAIKAIGWLFKNEYVPQKMALASLAKMIAVYDGFCNDTLMKFYDVLCFTLDIKLSSFQKKGKANEFYRTNMYRDLAICINIVEDTSSHITIHKAKGSEYENVLVINDSIKEFLCSPDLRGNEEHRIIYVAISRAERKLFLHIDELSLKDEEDIKKKYSYLDIKQELANSDSKILSIAESSDGIQTI